jgi:hypothetical protein
LLKLKKKKELKSNGLEEWLTWYSACMKLSSNPNTKQKKIKNRVSLLCPSHPEPRSSYLYFLHSWDDRHVPLHPAFID